MRFKFFLLPTLSPLQAKYHFPSIIIAEGLAELGIPFGANIDYWFPENESQYLFQATHHDCPVHIYDYLYLLEHPECTETLDYKKINVLIDNADGYETFALKAESHKFDLVLRAHYNKYQPYAQNVVSWPFALSNRIIDTINESTEQQVQPRVMVTYRVNMDLRKLTNEHLVPLLEKQYAIYQFESNTPGPDVAENPKSYWWQTGRRHDPTYYRELNQSLLNLALGGIFAPKPYPQGVINTIDYNISRAILKLSPRLKAKGYRQYVFQYDSWRLWESFVANTCPIFINFERWGLQWPVNPVAGQHYLQVDIDNYASSAKKILAMDEKEIKELGQLGRTWALNHYAPKAMANRFLNLVDGLRK